MRALSVGLEARRRRGLLASMLAASLACCAERPGPAPGPGHWMELGGRAVLPIGDSVTQGWMELGRDFDQEAYVEALARRGINALLLWTYIGVMDQQADDRIGYDAPELWPWPRRNGRFDLSSFEEAYFTRLRSLAELANRAGILVVLTVHDGWPKTRFEGHPFHARHGGPLKRREQYVQLAQPGRFLPETLDPAWGRRERHQFFLERFCARLVAATGDLPNVAYEIFNEGEWYKQDALHAFQEHFLSFFEARTERPLLVNDDHVRGASFHGDPRVDVVSLHLPNWGPRHPRTDARRAFEHYSRFFTVTPHKPYFFTEPVPSFEGDPSQLRAIMRLMWGTALAGAGFVMQNDTSFGFAPRARMAAHAEARDRLLDLEGHAARFLNRSLAALPEMAPDGAVASTGVALVHRGREYAIYAQPGGALTVDLRDAPGRFVARFYDPWEGVFREPFRISGGSAVPFEKPDDARDWVLHLLAASR